MNYVIVGSGAAGVTAASGIRQKDPDAKILLLEESAAYPYSPCSLPYVLSGEISGFEDITTFDQDFFDQNKITFLRQAQACSIDVEKKKIRYVYEDKKKTSGYDKLILATGADTFVPPIEGLNSVKYHKLKTIDDAKKIERAAKTKKKCLIIGGGVIGIELANSLNEKGQDVTIIEASDKILGGILDTNMSKHVEKELEAKGVNILKSSKVIKATKTKVFTESEAFDYGLLVISSGIRSRIELAKKAGLNTAHGIIIDEYSRTSDKDIYACGDCAEFFGSAALATNAIIHAEVAVDNIFGGTRKIRKLLNTTVTKSGKKIIASTGDTEESLLKKGKTPICSVFKGKARAEYYPSDKEIMIKLVSDSKGYIKGCQIISDVEVVGRINWVALAIQKKMKAHDLLDVETSYNPALCPIFDPVIVAAKMLARKIR